MNLASRGLRDMDAGSEPVADPAALAQIRQQARRVHAQALGAALLATVAVVLLPI